jgi:hypothetical protein
MALICNQKNGVVSKSERGNSKRTKRVYEKTLNLITKPITASKHGCDNRVRKSAYDTLLHYEEQ